MTVRRWTHPQVACGKAVAHWISNGLKGCEWEFEEGIPIRSTTWGLDGSVQTQASNQPGEIKTSPPWLWNVTDQTEPTDPQWIAEHGKQ